MPKEPDMENLIQRILNDDSKFSCLKIDRDPMDPKGEFHIYLLEEMPDNKPSQLLELPLMPFGTLLAAAFENQLTTTTLCFVADASAGKATSLLESLVKESKTGVAVLSEPLWMLQIARILQAQLFPTEKMKTLVFGLCRLDAWKFRDQVAKDSRTVMITLPGQATTSSLLPLLQSAFPEDRHVFAYDTCGASVYRGMNMTKAFRRGTVQEELNSILQGLCQNPIRHTTPLPSNAPLTKTLNGLSDALGELRIEIAQGVETWMSSVDAFFKLKQDEAKNGYLPYTLKTSFLTKPDNPTFDEKSSSYWSLCSLLQFITGCRSRALPEGVIDAACRFLEDYNRDHPEPKIPFTREQEKAIENCVFHHKLILIPNKTLQDTVQPSQHWTLKQAAKKGGCACCGPDPFDEEEEEEERKNAAKNAMGMPSSTPGAFASMAANASSAGGAGRNSYVDGKMGFAFDPTKFS
mmetsp:Transcript_113302/g.169438  ORF Transcript_113302/g.169438 Transcript_113302/m.169438 type:complete len:464 (+) Transcript_113302:1-1392(+)